MRSITLISSLNLEIPEIPFTIPTAKFLLSRTGPCSIWTSKKPNRSFISFNELIFDGLHPKLFKACSIEILFLSLSFRSFIKCSC